MFINRSSKKNNIRPRAIADNNATYHPEHVVFMENLSSDEYIVSPGQDPRPVLSNISLLIPRGEAWGFIGPSLLETKLLLEIMANIRSYGSGRCVLVERGMLRHKRVILKHVFYIGDSEMIYENMNVLEYLMFVTANSSMNVVERQEAMFQQLLEMGLGHISLTPNQLLTSAEKAVVQLLSAAHSNSEIIIFNLPEYDFSEPLIQAISNISRFICSQNKTFILGTQSTLLLEQACNDAVILGNGQILYNGTVALFNQTFDKVEVIMKDINLLALQQKLGTLFPQFTVSVKNNCIHVCYRGDGKIEAKEIAKQIIGSGVIPDELRINHKNFSNAYEEFMLHYDLQS